MSKCFNLFKNFVICHDISFLFLGRFQNKENDTDTWIRFVNVTVGFKKIPCRLFCKPDQLQHLKIKQPGSKRTYSHFNCIVLPFVIFCLHPALMSQPRRGKSGASIELSHVCTTQTKKARYSRFNSCHLQLFFKRTCCAKHFVSLCQKKSGTNNLSCFNRLK